MFIRFGIVLSLLYTLAACAVVEPLSGGEEDTFAPQPNLEKMVPANGTTNFSGNEMIIPFDEFFTLNNPSENIIVIPPDIKPIAKIKNKNLVLTWKEQLQPNTTYAFYLNNLVQDFSEKNDSLMSFVFSTGASIDSLTARFEVRDAFEKTTLAGQTVGLYTAFNDTILPNYFGKTDASGQVVLRYLKPGTYQLVAFNDKNKNLKPEKTEALGYRLSPFTLDASVVDTGAVLVSPPFEEPKISEFTYVPPSALLLGANRNLQAASFKINGDLIPTEQLLFFRSDSIQLPFVLSDSANYELIVDAGSWQDTSSFRVQNKDRQAGLSVTLQQKKDLPPNEGIRLYTNQLISNVDSSAVLLRNAKDSSAIPIKKIDFSGLEMRIDFERKEDINALELLLLPSAVQSVTRSNGDTLRFKINVISSRDVGELAVKLEGYNSALVLDLLSNGKLHERITLSKTVHTHTFENLLPGEYTFRVIIDENENGRWDGGNLQTQTPPESVDLFPKTTKVRGNWNSEITLQKNGI